MSSYSVVVKIRCGTTAYCKDFIHFWLGVYAVARKVLSHLMYGTKWFLAVELT